MLFISGHSHEYLADHGIAIPPDAFLEKPFTPPKLAARVRALLDASKHRS
jgi:DNA-binding response OmpR family regulator